MQFYKFILIFICLLFVSKVEAGTVNLLNTNEHVYHIGLLVEQTNGTTDLIVGSPMLGHERLLDKYEDNTAKVVKILWAGELEEINGTVVRANETAGIIEAKEYLSKNRGIDISGSGIDNLKGYVETHKDIQKKYFNKTDYIRFSEDNKHLNEYLDDVSYLRHDFIRDIQVIIAVYDNMIQADTYDPKYFITRASLIANNVLTRYNNATKLFPELNSPEWKAFSAELALLSTYSETSKPIELDSYSPFIDKFEQERDGEKHNEITVVGNLNFDEITKISDRGIKEKTSAASVPEMEAKIKEMYKLYSIMNDEVLYAQLQKEMDYFNKESSQRYLPGLQPQKNIVDAKLLIADMDEMRHVWGNCTLFHYQDYNDYPEKRERYLSVFLVGAEGHKASLSLLLAEFFKRKHGTSETYEDHIVHFMEMINTFTDAVPASNSTVNSKKAMKKALQEIGDKDLGYVVRSNMELFTDDNIISLLNDVEDANRVPTKAEENVRMAQIKGIIDTKIDCKLKVGEELNHKFSEVKAYLESGKKDEKIFTDRMNRNFDVEDGGVDILVHLLIEREGVLETGKETKIFFGTKGRNFQDSLYNRVKKLNNKELSDKFFLLSLMVMVNNENIIVSGEDVSAKAHMLNFIRVNKGFFKELESFVSKDGWENRTSLELTNVLQRMDLLRRDVERLKIEFK